MLKRERGITLIALIITIIIMLILVGVTINVALNGGLFEKGEKASYQTNVSTIKEKVTLKIAEELANNNGTTKEDYGITIESLELTGKLKEFEEKLVISNDGTLCYVKDKVSDKERAWLEEVGIKEGKGQNPVVGTYYIPGSYNESEYMLNLKGDGTIYVHEDAGMPKDLTYTYTDSTVTLSNGLVLKFYDLGNNKILMNESLNYFLAMNRNGLEGEILNGTYVDEKNNTLTIDAELGTCKITYAQGIPTETGGVINSSSINYFYYNNKIYWGEGIVLGTFDSESGTLTINFNDQEYNFTI